MKLGKHTLAAQHTLGIFTSFTEKETVFNWIQVFGDYFFKKYSG
jgi:hypothetical protein